MATLKSNDNKEMIIMCDCGCDEGIRVKIEEAFGESVIRLILVETGIKSR